jgi:hypothetical protein
MRRRSEELVDHGRASRPVLIRAIWHLLRERYAVTEAGEA